MLMLIIIIFIIMLIAGQFCERQKSCHTCQYFIFLQRHNEVVKIW